MQKRKKKTGKKSSKSKLVLWKDQLNRQTFSLDWEQEREDLKVLKSEIHKWRYYQFYKNKKDNKRMLWTFVSINCII